MIIDLESGVPAEVLDIIFVDLFFEVMSASCAPSFNEMYKHYDPHDQCGNHSKHTANTF